MESLRSTLGGDANLPAGGPAVFRRIIRRQDLDFLSGIHVGGADAGAIRAGANRRRAIVGDQTFRRARAIDIRRALAEVKAQVRKRAAASARHEIGHEDRVAAVNLQRVNLFAGDDLLHRCGFGL